MKLFEEAQGVDEMKCIKNENFEAPMIFAKYKACEAMIERSLLGVNERDQSERNAVFSEKRGALLRFDPA